MADYVFYASAYYGNKIKEDDFPRLAARAGEILALFERDYTVTGNIKARDKAICALAEAIQDTEKAQIAALSGGSITGQSIGSVSVSYAAPSPDKAGIDLSERAAQRRYYDTARRYLTIFRGVR